MSNFNSMEAFAEWFDENIKSLEECETEGVDIEYEMKKWCEKNNHDYNDYDDSRRIGVYNNTDDILTCEKSFRDIIKDGDNKLTALYRLQHHELHSVFMLKFNGDETKFNEWFDEFCDNNGICEIYDDEVEDEEENHTCHLCGYECADMVYPDKEETPFCDKCWIKEQLDINSIYYAGDYNEDDEFLETKCGCEIIVNSREHDECRCDEDGENWICSNCYNGEYDEEK